ncbi:MAG: hypothetical protein AMDU4_FER2C00018G0025 [Ferroplasma sp. Type II]|jgi:hypothetical protein|uniref:hypothetical protein n=1 Tax=Ferroplasma sp. Type II TaxID=261388 RepID=UPI0003894706|nr:hypothetical protein [Ferroplasma sp. Type II]EQB74261.1 MAG: hypothetical protein AMDU4_FER2C00018G0025 [Ferroplasma sp. Type II]HIH59937.1 hypothetical protein [Ferroplasma sp.]HII82223.1 hypothetical protein [Ferroplasma sp.]
MGNKDKETIPFSKDYAILCTTSVRSDPETLGMLLVYRYSPIIDGKEITEQIKTMGGYSQ